MIVDRNTKISEILKEKPEAIDAIASINRHFKKLQNPFLRKMLAPRVNVAAAAQVGNSTINNLLKVLEELGFQVAYEQGETETMTEKTQVTMKKANVVDMDVRPILESGVDPFNVIMEGLKNMTEG
jgi:UDP-N-acetylglucosamine enolpyruvyl transferase